MTFEEAKCALVNLSRQRDDVLDGWHHQAVAIQGFMEDHPYARDWKEIDDQIKQILEDYPELNHEH